MSNVSILKSGAAEYQWVKKSINKKDFSFYENSPSYQTLYQNEGNRIVAFRRLVETNNPLPHHLDLCDPKETEKLERRNDPNSPS